MKKSTLIVLAIFLFTLTIRLILAFSLPNFTYESYFHLRQVEHITETGLPLYDDPLSAGGRTLLFPPFFHYLAAPFALLLPLEIVAKILPNLFIASLTIIIFYLSCLTTKNETSSFFAAGIVGFLPILYSTNAFTPETLAIPLLLLTIYAFLRSENTPFMYLYLFCFIFLSFTSSAAFLLLCGYAFYLLLSFIERKDLPAKEIELMIASLFFYLWSQLLFYKNVLLQEGIHFIWQNIPSPLLSSYYPQVSVSQAVIYLSLLPLLAGIYVIYASLFRSKKASSFFLISIVISTILLTIIRIIPFKTALAFLGVLFAILFALFYGEISHYAEKTKLQPQHQRLIFWSIVILLLTTTVYPAISTAWQQDLPSEKEIAAFRWLESHTAKDQIILALVKEGHLLTYYSHRQNLLDDNFNLIDAQQRFHDLDLLYQTKFQTEALSLLEKHSIRYIMLTPAAQQQYHLKRLPYLTPQCFSSVYNDEVYIYEAKCSLERT